jgi:hypothetical protein
MADGPLLRDAKKSPKPTRGEVDFQSAERETQNNLSLFFFHMVRYFPREFAAEVRTGLGVTVHYIRSCPDRGSGVRQGLHCPKRQVKQEPD